MLAILFKKGIRVRVEGNKRELFPTDEQKAWDIFRHEVLSIAHQRRLSIRYAGFQGRKGQRLIADKKEAKV